MAGHDIVRTERGVGKGEGEGGIRGYRYARKANAGSLRWQVLVPEDTSRKAWGEYLHRINMGMRKP